MLPLSPAHPSTGPLRTTPTGNGRRGSFYRYRGDKPIEPVKRPAKPRKAT